MQIRIREIYNKEIAIHYIDHVALTDNLLWIEDDKGLPLFVVKEITAVILPSRNIVL